MTYGTNTYLSFSDKLINTKASLKHPNHELCIGALSQQIIVNINEQHDRSLSIVQNQLCARRVSPASRFGSRQTANNSTPPSRYCSSIQCITFFLGRTEHVYGIKILKRRRRRIWRSSMEKKEGTDTEYPRIIEGGEEGTRGKKTKH